MWYTIGKNWGIITAENLSGIQRCPRWALGVPAPPTIKRSTERKATPLADSYTFMHKPVLLLALNFTGIIRFDQGVHVARYLEFRKSLVDVYSAYSVVTQGNIAYSHILIFVWIGKSEGTATSLHTWFQILTSLNGCDAWASYASVNLLEQTTDNELKYGSAID